ncbi:hypothetical protein GCM10023322_44110 [Rugosimonospora acidiphila]|uniref:Uncharacterized protein n=1 Tax=Rugosimonospora acidiphila TaxID=556531 RepID=A0ABP9S0U4_9ACTN
MRAIRVAIAGAAAVAAMLAVAPTVATAAPAAPAAVGGAGAYYSLAPSRILDTRSGVGAPAAAVGPNGVLHLQVTGRGGVPAHGAASVVLNVTVVSPTGSSYLTVWPTGAARPTVSNIDFPAGWTGANSTTVSLGSGGKVDIYNLTGNVQILADVVGFYASDGTVTSTLGDGGDMVPAEPGRLVDTREDGGPVGSGGEGTVTVDFGPDYNPYIQAVAVNVTVVDATGSGFLTTWNGQTARPGTSTLDYAAGKTVSNMVIVPTAPCTVDPTCAGIPAFEIYNQGATTDILVDVFAIYTDTAQELGGRFQPMNPVRIIDTRSGQGGHGALGTGTTAEFIPPASVQDAGTYALAANVTAVSSTADTYLTAWESDDPRPDVSNLDPAKGATICNTAPLSLSFADGGFDVYNHAGTINVLVDVEGRFEVPDAVTANARAASPAAKAAMSPVAAIGHHLYR